MEESSYIDVDYEPKGFSSVLFALPEITTAAGSPNYGMISAVPTYWSKDKITVRVYNASGIKPSLTVRVLVIGKA